MALLKKRECSFAEMSRWRLKSTRSDGEKDSDEGESSEIDYGLSLTKLFGVGPKKKLLVLSLNGVLISRFHLIDRCEVPRSRRPDGRYGKRLVYKRPYCDRFMEFCFERFEVGVWSSAMERNVDGVLDCAMGGMRNKLLFVWDQSQCTETGFECSESRRKPLFLKQLKKVWDYFEKFPRGCHYSASDTLFIDDDPYKSLLNPPNTAIFPESYNASNVTDDVLDPKGELGLYLDGLAAADDVQTYVKEHPFGQPAITASHSDRGYLSRDHLLIDSFVKFLSL